MTKLRSGRILTVFLFFLGLGLLLALGSHVMLPKDNTVPAGMDDVTAKGFLAEPEDSIDVIFLGDSISYSAFSPMLMWEERGFTSYVCGASAQPLYDVSRMLDAALSTQSPRAVVLETNTIFRDVTLRNLAASKLKGLFPIFHYHNRWKTLTGRDFYAPVRFTKINHFKGYLYNTGIDPGLDPDYMAASGEFYPLSDANRLSLQEILGTCRDRDIPLILVSAPCMYYWSREKHNTVARFAEENGLTYWDLNLETRAVPIDWNLDTRDKGDHLNHTGAEKVSRYLGRTLQAHLSLPDHRQDPAFAGWNRSLEICKTSLDPVFASRNP